MNTVSKVAEILNLQPFHILSIEYLDQEVLVRAKLKKRYVKCPRCGRGSNKAHQHNHLRKVLCDIWGQRKVYLVSDDGIYACLISCIKGIDDLVAHFQKPELTMPLPLSPPAG